VVVWLTLDSSVIIAALNQHERQHRECRSLLERVKDGEFLISKHARIRMFERNSSEVAI
jgi:predicted nucleic acid-binding protein